MSKDSDSEVFSLFQPDLLSTSDLIGKIQMRCCRVENLSSMSKERLVRLFRQIMFPLPQRFYRTNRRGKMLTARREKAGLQGNRKGGQEEARNSEVQSRSKIFFVSDRLKPPPDNLRPNKIRINSHVSSNENRSNSVDLDRIVINEREKKRERDKSTDEGSRDKDPNKKSNSFSSRKIILKRSLSSTEGPSPQPVSSSEIKKQRKTIIWP